MRIILFFILLSTLTCSLFSQVISTNRNPVGLESNILFRANSRYTVTATNFESNHISALFDGSFSPIYNASATSSSPSVILIEDLPGYHIQAGAWVGWSTRYCPPVKFKIEGYDAYYGNGWIPITEYYSSPYSGSDFIVGMPAGAFTKLKFTFYEGECSNIGISFGVSELYFIHPEAATPYSGLFETVGSTWNKNGNDINFINGKVGIGIAVPKNLLDVNGTIHAREVKVDLTGWSDFVFHPSYHLKPLVEVEQFIKTNGHLQDIPSAAEVEQNGVNVGEMQKKLLQKVEELTLYVIEKDKEIAALKAEKDRQLVEQQKLLMDLKKEIEILKTK